MATKITATSRQILVVLLLLVHFRNATALVTQEYSSEDASTAQTTLDIGCAETQPAWIRSIIECAIACSSDSSCFGVSVDPTRRCSLYRQCATPQGLVYNDSHHYVMKQGFQPCLNGGEWPAQLDRCRCRGGWYGQHCNTIAPNCSALASSGYLIEDAYVTLNIYPYSAVGVYCHLRSSGPSYIRVLKNTGRHAPFNHSYNVFVDGFNTSDGDYWIGLELLNAISQEAGHDSHQVTIVAVKGGMEYGFILKPQLVLVKYYPDQLRDTYRLKVDFESVYLRSGNPDYTTYPNRCFPPHHNSYFSTYDYDNDGDHGQNCAAQTGNGWWFYGCDAKCNLLGTWPAAAPSEAIRLHDLDLQLWNPESLTIEWLIDF